MSDDRPVRDYAVGRGKPIVHSRFQPGRSGNPQGRPKHARDMSTCIEEELAQVVTITEHGRKKKVNMRTLIAKRAVNLAVRGNPKMLLQLMKSGSPSSALSTLESQVELFDSDADEETLRGFLASLGGDER